MANKARFINTERIDWDIEGNFPVYTRDYFRITGAHQRPAEWDTDVDVKKQDESEYAEPTWKDDLEGEGPMENTTNPFEARQFESFEQELAHVINKWSMEQGSGTPDYILANYLNNHLAMLGIFLQDRARGLGESIHPFSEPLRTCGNACCGCHLI